MIRCAFCGKPASEPLPVKTTGNFRIKCGHCGRLFLVIVRKRWWGYQYRTHII